MKEEIKEVKVLEDNENEICVDKDIKFNSINTDGLATCMLYKLFPSENLMEYMWRQQNRILGILTLGYLEYEGKITENKRRAGTVQTNPVDGKEYKVIQFNENLYEEQYLVWVSHGKELPMKPRLTNDSTYLQVLEHIDENTLNNCIENLRIKNRGSVSLKIL